MLTLVLCPPSTGWSTGHSGVDRPGNPADTISAKRLETTGACYESCLKLAACASWTFESAGCGDERAGRCTLRSTVPRQQLAPQEEECQVASGTSAPARAGGLVPLLYKPLPLGNITVRGWLRDQLVTMANGLSGHLELFWDDVHDSVWIGGTHDHSGAGHERGPYWLNGMVPLAAYLNATGDATSGGLKVDLNEQVNRWVSKILDAQLPNGWLGPDDGFGGKGNTYWNGWNVAASLLQYADAQTNAGRPDVAARCNLAVLKYVTEVHRRMLTTPLTSWSQNRWQDWVYIIHWLMDQAPQGQEQMLWDAAELTQQQSWDWDAYYNRAGVGSTGAFKGKSMPKFAIKNVGGWTMYDHGVNNAMGTKSCAVWYRQSGNATDAQASYKKLAMQDTYHGQPHGIWAADECFGGLDLNRGIELCAVVEQMYSLQHMFRVQGDPAFLDKCERIAYNALPGTIDPIMWRHQYLQQANEINALYAIKDHVWQTDGDDSTGFGVDPNFGCCTANMQQGWPKLVSNVILQKGSGAVPTLLVAMLAPVEASLGDVRVRIVTDYPFGDNATIYLAGQAALEIRIPGWATAAQVSVNGGPAAPAKNGTMHTIAAGAAASATIQLFLNPAVRVEKGWGRAATNGSSLVSYSASGAIVPSSQEEDWDLDIVKAVGGTRKPSTAEVRAAPHDVAAEIAARFGEHSQPHQHGAGSHAHGSGSHHHHGSSSQLLGGCSFAHSRDPTFTSDIRTGDPGQVSTAVIGHPIWGAASPTDPKAHSVAGLSLSFRYVAGYTPPAGVTKMGPTVSVVLVDAANQSDVATLYTSPELNKYSFDDYKGYSPPINIAVSNLRVPNGRALLVALRIHNNERNLQIPLDPAGGMSVRLSWSAAATEAAVPPPQLGEATNAAAILRGPLLYSLYLEEECSGVVKTWLPFNNTDVDLITQTTWNFAISAAPSRLRFEQLGAPGRLPFNTSRFPSVIHAKARAVPGWTSSRSAADEPPASPLSASELGSDETNILLVPYGASNLRMAGLPWYE